MEEIILWGSDGETIRACELAVYQALKELSLKARVTINSEPPLISRNQLWERLPVLEIRGLRWSLRPGQPFTAEQLTRLFAKVFLEQVQSKQDPAAGEGQTGTPQPPGGEGDVNAG
jgi:hypothetical protein